MSEKAWLLVIQTACTVLITVEGLIHQFITEREQQPKQ